MRPPRSTSRCSRAEPPSRAFFEREATLVDGAPWQPESLGDGTRHGGERVAGIQPGAQQLVERRRRILCGCSIWRAARDGEHDLAADLGAPTRGVARRELGERAVPYLLEALGQLTTEHHLPLAEQLRQIGQRRGQAVR